jgi:hypothetical protein
MADIDGRPAMADEPLTIGKAMKDALQSRDMMSLVTEAQSQARRFQP